jgi:dTDP-glucose 4,6-dehydratase
MTGRRVLVAGGSGFIGSHLCGALLRAGDSVVVIDNLVTGVRSNLVSIQDAPGFSFVEHDVTEPLAIDGELHVVLHLASPASPKDFSTLQLEILAAGSVGTRHLLDLAGAKGARFLLASTSEVYGDPQVHPQPETYWGHVNPVGPRSCYDEAKRFAEALTVAHRGQRGTDVRIARIFNTYGPLMRPGDGRVVTNFLVQAITGAPLTVYGSGHQTRSFCYVDDLVAGLLAVLDGDVTDPVNLGNDDEFTIRRLADLVLEVTGSRSAVVEWPAPLDDPMRRRPDVTVARSRLDWAPHVGLREGLTMTAEWLRTVL